MSSQRFQIPTVRTKSLEGREFSRQTNRSMTVVGEQQLLRIIQY
jgi:hypothetical protein